MKKLFLIIFLSSIVFNISFTNASSIDTSHCTNPVELNLCIKKAYAKKITIQNTIIKNSFKNSDSLIKNIDDFIIKYEKSSEKINALAIRAIGEIELLSGSPQDQNLQLLFEYILYKAQYTSIELALIAADNKRKIEEGKTYKLDLPDTPKDIGDYLAIIDYLAEEEIGEYINDLDYKEKEKIAKKITLTNQEIINYFSVEERDVSNASTIEKNIYYRLLIFYEYLEDNPAVWAEYKARKNEKK